MIRTVFKIIFTLLLVILSIVFYKQQVETTSWGSYTPIILQSDDDLETSVELLESNGFKEYLHRGNVTLGINNYNTFEERSLEDISNNLDRNDYRYDPYIDSIDQLFKTASGNGRVIYLKMNNKDLVSLFNIYKVFNESAVSYKIGNPLVLRTVLNYICFILLLLLLGGGCRTRFLLSLIAGVIAFFFMEASSVYSYTVFTVGFILIIMIVESFSFSNRYIKRNNVGIFRLLLSIVLFLLPTFFPSFINQTDVIYTPLVEKGAVFDYDSFEAVWDKNEATISNYLAHYTFQKSFLYGDKYLFPTKGNSVTIDEFKREDYYLSRYEKVVFRYDEAYLKGFLAYCNTTVLGRFYIDYGRPFKLELNSLLSLYIKENEYMYISILAVSMLITSLLFKKNRDKN